MRHHVATQIYIILVFSTIHVYADVLLEFLSRTEMYSQFCAMNIKIMRIHELSPIQKDCARPSYVGFAIIDNTERTKVLATVDLVRYLYFIP